MDLHIKLVVSLLHPPKVDPSNIFSSSELFNTLSIPFHPPCISYSRWSFKLNQQGKHSRTIGYGKNQHYHVRLFWWTVSFNDKYLIFRATAIYLTQPPSAFAQCLLLPDFLLGVFLLLWELASTMLLLLLLLQHLPPSPLHSAAHMGLHHPLSHNSPAKTNSPPPNSMHSTLFCE